MSGDKLLSSFAAKVGAPPPKADEPDNDTVQDFVAFGWLRGHDRAIMLELRLRNGNILALGYSWLEQVEFDPSEGIVLTFSGQRKVKIIGRGLNTDVRLNIRLLDGLIRHKVPWVRERDLSQFDDVGKKAIVIECIQCEFA